MLAPWVDPFHSKVKYLQAAQLIPVSAFGAWHLLPKFFVLQAGPAFASSGSLFTRISSAVSPPRSREEEQDQNSRRWETDYGLNPDSVKELRDHATKSMFAESTVGANSEALLCLKKGQGADWGACEDYGAFVRQLAASEQERRAGTDPDRSRVRLRVRAYFAESDAMTGTKGQEYLARCFNGQSDEAYVEAIDFGATTVAGTDHDSVLESIATLEDIFVEAGGRLPTSGQ